MKNSQVPSLSSYSLVFAALLALLVVTAATARLQLGHGVLVINAMTAVLQAGLVMVFFMHLKRASAIYRMVALVAFLWPLLLLTLTLGDYLTRVLVHAPW